MKQPVSQNRKELVGSLCCCVAAALLQNLPMWLSVHEVQAARELEDRIGFCPYPHVTIDQGKVVFRVNFDENDTRVSAFC